MIRLKSVDTPMWTSNLPVRRRCWSPVRQRCCGGWLRIGCTSRLSEQRRMARNARPLSVCGGAVHRGLHAGGGWPRWLTVVSGPSCLHSRGAPSLDLFRDSVLRKSAWGRVRGFVSGTPAGLGPATAAYRRELRRRRSKHQKCCSPAVKT